MDLSRKGFLLLGVSGAATAAGGVLGAGTALGAPPPVAPQGDDLGFLAFGAVGEGAARAFYKQALATPGLFDAGERRHLEQARRAKRDHLMKLNAAMGADAVSSGDFAFDLPKTAFSSRDRAVAFGTSLEELLVGVYLNGAGYAAGLPIPMSTEAAGDALDKLVTVPGSPGGR